MRRLSRGKAARGGQGESHRQPPLHIACFFFSGKKPLWWGQCGQGEESYGALDREASPRGTSAQPWGGAAAWVLDLPAGELVSRRPGAGSEELMVRRSHGTHPTRQRQTHTPYGCTRHAQRHGRDTRSATHTTHSKKHTSTATHRAAHNIHTHTHAHACTRTHTCACAQEFYYCQSFPRPPPACPQEEPQPWSHLLREDSPLLCLPPA